MGSGTRIAARGRFDHNDFSVKRGEIGAETALGAITASAAYLYIRKDPNIQINSPTATVSGNASVNILDNWRLFGSLTYDITKATLAKDSVGIAFDNSCLTFSVAYSEVRDEFTDIPNSRNVMVGAGAPHARRDQLQGRRHQPRADNHRDGHLHAITRGPRRTLVSPDFSA